MDNNIQEVSNMVGNLRNMVRDPNPSVLLLLVKYMYLVQYKRCVVIQSAPKTLDRTQMLPSFAIRSNYLKELRHCSHNKTTRVVRVATRMSYSISICKYVLEHGWDCPKCSLYSSSWLPNCRRWTSAARSGGRTGSSTALRARYASLPQTTSVATRTSTS